MQGRVPSDRVMLPWCTNWKYADGSTHSDDSDSSIISDSSCDSEGMLGIKNVLKGFIAGNTCSLLNFIYCLCTYFSVINILAELALNQVRLFINTLICFRTMKCIEESSICANS